MTPDRAYRWLMEASQPTAGDGFDLHVCACILGGGLSAQAEEERVSLAATTGLDAAALGALCARNSFPAPRRNRRNGRAKATRARPEEKSVRDILLMYAAGDRWISRGRWRR